MIGLIAALVLSAYFFVDRYIIIGTWQEDFFIFWGLGIMIGIFLGLSGALYKADNDRSAPPSPDL